MFTLILRAALDLRNELTEKLSSREVENLKSL